MRMQLALLALLAGGVAGATEPKGAAATEPEGVMDPKADAALKKMSTYVGGLGSFRVDTKTVDEKVTTTGQKIQEVQQSKVTVQRPGSLSVERISPRGHAVLKDDGNEIGLYNKEKNVYATAKAPPTIDAAVEAARDKLHAEAPAADLLVANPYDVLVDGTIEGRYVGLEPLDGVMAHHIAISKKDNDLQLWIKDGPEAVPLRYVITTKDVKGQPQFTAELTNWQPNVTVSKEVFLFTPPAGAKKITVSAQSKAPSQGGEEK
jgi:hypothetical protein